MTWRVHLDSRVRFGHLGYRMYVMRVNYDRSFDVMHNASLQHYEPYAASSEDQFFLSDERPGDDTKAFLQAMSDAAWEIGIKPKQLEGHTDELKAVRYHLEDMRTLVLKK